MATPTRLGTPRPKTESHPCNTAGTRDDSQSPTLARRTNRTVHSWAAAIANDIDDITVDRLISGKPPATYTAFERREAVRRLRIDHHLTQPQIARRLRIDRRQVVRDLERFGLVDSGAKAAQLAEAARRRVVVARLVAAGARSREIARLLNVPEDAVTRDRIALGIAGERIGCRPCRSRDELLATYAHLLDHNTTEATG